MGQATVHPPSRLPGWAIALVVAVAVLAAVLISLQAAPQVIPSADVARGSTSTSLDTPAPVPTTCGLPSHVARAEGLDPRTCATPRTYDRTTGPR
jgi:hypothetical protein